MCRMGEIDMKHHLKGLGAAAFGLCAAMFGTQAAAAQDPVIDVHLHAESVSAYGPPGQKMCMEHLKYVPPVDPVKENMLQTLGAWNRNPGCADPIPAAASDEALMRETIAVLKKRNIRGVVSGPPETVAAWKQAAPDHIIAGRQFNLAREADISADDIAAEFKSGAFEVLAEVTNQYAGHGPNSPAFDAYWAAAEANDIPVGIHIGGMPPGAAYWGTGARAALGDALLLEEILIRHPKLRVYIMHAGMPQFERTFALMQQFPHVYAETGVMQTVMTRGGYEEFLRRAIDAGLGKRIMYGTDQMIWPGMISRSLDLVEATDALTPEQKRDFLYNNAVRFFRLDDEE